jgi:hypothetical protein
MNQSPKLSKSVQSPKDNAPLVLVLGRTSSRMHEVMVLIQDAGGISATGCFTEAELIHLLKSSGRVSGVLLGGGVTEPERKRIRQFLAAAMPHVQLSEPGIHYPYSDANILADLRRITKHSGPAEPEPTRTAVLTDSKPEQ